MAPRITAIAFRGAARCSTLGGKTIWPSSPAANKFAEREEAGRQLQSLSESLADLTSAFPSSPQEAEFLAAAFGSAGRSSVRLKNFRPGQVTAAGSVNTCDMHLSLVGSFAGICTLLDGLAQVPRLLCVPRLTLTGPPSAGDACVADLTISLCFAPPIQTQ